MLGRQPHAGIADWPFVLFGINVSFFSYSAEKNSVLTDAVKNINAMAMYTCSTPQIGSHINVLPGSNCDR